MFTNDCNNVCKHVMEWYEKYTKAGRNAFDFEEMERRLARTARRSLSIASYSPDNRSAYKIARIWPLFAFILGQEEI